MMMKAGNNVLKWINGILVVTFALLCIQFSFIFMNGLEAAYLSLVGFWVNRIIQPIALLLIGYAFFKKPSVASIVFYCVHILFIVLFFIEMLAVMIAVDDQYQMM